MGRQTQDLFPICRTCFRISERRRSYWKKLYNSFKNENAWTNASALYVPGKSVLRPSLRPKCPAHVCALDHRLPSARLHARRPWSVWNSAPWAGAASTTRCLSRKSRWCSSTCTSQTSCWANRRLKVRTQRNLLGLCWGGAPKTPTHGV